MTITGPAASLPKYLNPIMRPMSRWVPPLALVHHVGRRSGNQYTTPVQAYKTDHGYIVALAYDRDAAWALNLLAAGHGQLTRLGKEHELSNVRRSGPEGLERLPRATAKLMRALKLSDFIEFDVVTARPDKPEPG